MEPRGHPGNSFITTLSLRFIGMIPEGKVCSVFETWENAKTIRALPSERCGSRDLRRIVMRRIFLDGDKRYREERFVTLVGDDDTPPGARGLSCI